MGDDQVTDDSSSGIPRREALRRIGAGVGAAAGWLALTNATSERAPSSALPKAKLVLLGGAIDAVRAVRAQAKEMGMGEDELVYEELTKKLSKEQLGALTETGDPAGIYKALKSHIPYEGKTVVVVTSASEESAKAHAAYDSFYFRLQGASRVVSISDRNEANQPYAVDAITSPDTVLVYFDGGDQAVLKDRFMGTKAYEAMMARYVSDRHFAVAGSSAGAAVMAGQDSMIKNWNSNKDGPLMSSGLGLLEKVVVDTHIHRNPDLPRLPRLAQAVRRCPHCIGLGMDEGTGVVIADGQATVIGTQKVWVLAPEHTGISADALHRELPSYVAGQAFSLGEHACISGQCGNALAKRQ